MKNYLKKSINGMTLPEVSLSLMVLVVFMSVFAISTKFIQVKLRSSTELDEQNNSWVRNKHLISGKMDNWSEILSQPSYSRDFILNLSCRYPRSDNLSIWNLPGESDLNLPKNYKFCIKATSLSESDMDDLINEKENAKPGIYFLYALPSKITPSSLPIRRLFCRPITYC